MNSATIPVALGTFLSGVYIGFIAGCLWVARVKRKRRPLRHEYGKGRGA